jgi:hypothetical protein
MTRTHIPANMFYITLEQRLNLFSFKLLSTVMTTWVRGGYKYRGVQKAWESGISSGWIKSINVITRFVQIGQILIWVWDLLYKIYWTTKTVHEKKNAHLRNSINIPIGTGYIYRSIVKRRYKN